MENVEEKVLFEKLEKAAFVLKSIAHPVRLKMLQLMHQRGEMSVTELSIQTNCEQSMTSHHLNNMKLKGLLTSRKDGKNIYYTLKVTEVMQVLECIDKCTCKL